MNPNSWEVCLEHFSETSSKFKTLIQFARITVCGEYKNWQPHSEHIPPRKHFVNLNFSLKVLRCTHWKVSIQTAHWDASSVLQIFIHIWLLFSHNFTHKLDGLFGKKTATHKNWASLTKSSSQFLDQSTKINVNIA